MPGGPMFAQMSASHLAAVFVLAGIVLACLLGILGLRFLRRGAARFWMAPATTALVLFPVVFAAGMATVLFLRTLDTMALVGSGGIAALAGATAESVLLLLLGLGAVAMLAFVGVLVTALGSSRSAVDAAGGGRALQGGAVLAIVLAAGLVVLVLGTVERVITGPPEPGAILARVQMCLVGSAGLALFLFALTLVTALRAPRRASPWSVTLLSLFLLSSSGLAALTGVWVVHRRVERLIQVAMTGHTVLDSVPAPAAPPGQIEPAIPSEPVADDAAPIDDVRAPVRVGGAIKEPRKLKHVSPVYPEIARNASVQGIVILEATIDRNGRVARVRVLRGLPLLDAAAVEAVEQWVYTPTLLNGVPVPVIMTVTVSFQLS